MKIVNSHLLSGFDNTLRNVISREQFYMFSFFIFQQEAKAGERLNLVFSPHFFIVIISNKTSSFLVISRLRPHSNKCSHFSWMRFPIRSIKWKRLEWNIGELFYNRATTAESLLFLGFLFCSFVLQDSISHDDMSSFNMQIF